MKKRTALGLALILVAFGLTGCKSAGGSKLNDLLSVLPKTMNGVVVIDVHRAITTEVVDKAIKDSAEYQKYQEFIKQTGIDPQKDIQSLVIGFSATGTGEEALASGAGVVSLVYDKTKLLAKIKELTPNLIEQTYEGIVLFASPEEKDKPMFGAFLDETRIAIGNEADIKSVIDVFKKKSESVLKNEKVAALIKTANTNAMAWSVIAFPPEMMKDIVAKNPMAADLADIHALSIFFDYANKALQLEIKGLGGDAEKNKKLADTLNGFKAIGGMAAGEKPEVGELLNKIEVTSAPDNIRIFASLPDELLNKLSKTAEAQVKEKLAGTKGEEKKAEDKKDEKKAEIKK